LTAAWQQQLSMHTVPRLPGRHPSRPRTHDLAHDRGRRCASQRQLHDSMDTDQVLRRPNLHRGVGGAQRTGTGTVTAAPSGMAGSVPPHAMSSHLFMYSCAGACAVASERTGPRAAGRAARPATGRRALSSRPCR